MINLNELEKLAQAAHYSDDYYKAFDDALSPEVVLELIHKTRAFEGCNSVIESYRAENEKLREALSNCQIRFGFLKNHHPCIGFEAVHVDGNCVHCSAKHFEDSARKALEGK